MSPLTAIEPILMNKLRLHRPNLGRGRHVPKHHTPFLVHRSVLTRMQAKGLKSGPYQPKAAPWADREPIWVD